jgi:hypothetical protein
MNFIHWVVLDPSAGWIRTFVYCMIALPLTNTLLRWLGWDKDEDVDEDEES